MKPTNAPCPSSRGMPWLSIQRYWPSWRRNRYSIENACWASKARWFKAKQRARSSGWTTSVQPLPISCAKLRPVKASQRSLNHSAFLSSPDIHSSTGEALATVCWCRCCCCRVWAMRSMAWPMRPSSSGSRIPVRACQWPWPRAVAVASRCSMRRTQVRCSSQVMKAITSNSATPSRSMRRRSMFQARATASALSTCTSKWCCG